MHLHRKVLRNVICAAALVTLALPLASPLAATPTHAQTTTTTPSKLPTACTPSTFVSTSPTGTGAVVPGTVGNCYVAATPPVAFNPIGAPHTVTFLCDALTNTLGTPGATLSLNPLATTTTALAPGCYDVTATATDITGGAATINSATCGNQVAAPSGSNVDCSGVASPICPVGSVPNPANVTFGEGSVTPCVPNCPAGFTATPATTTTAATCTLPIAATDVTAAACVAAGGTVSSDGTTCVNGTLGGSTIGFATAAACTAAGGTPTPAVAPTTCTIAAIAGATSSNTATVTINPGAAHAYTVDFTGYVPASTGGTCPAGMTAVTTKLTASLGEPPVSLAQPALPACKFTVEVQKKYVEINNIKLTGGPCGGSLFYAEGLKAFFGPSCSVTATATGMLTLKTGVNCANEPAPGTAAGGDFPSGATYNCVNGNLIVENIPLTGVPLTFQVTGPGSFNVLNTLNTSCAGVSGVTSASGVSGTPVTFCPTGPGAGTIQACVTSGPNNQPTPVCSNSISFTFTENERRVVPYVRWAGEKVALTKCFGPALAHSPIEFNLQGSNPGLDATLIPTELSTLLPNGTTTVAPNQSTIWAVTDANGCASVLGYAAGEGVMYVDAAIFNVSGAGLAAGAPIVNEHAFEVFFLKFDHLDLENINPTSVYSTSTALTPYLSFFSGTPAVNGASSFPSSFTLPSAPGANGQVAGPTGYAVPLCQTQYVRAMVHGYFEIPGDPSGRPATSVAIPGTPISSGGTPSTGSYVLPAGRWVLPEDWPVLATFAGFSAAGAPNGSFTPSSVLAWDLNSGWVFNPSGENPVFCRGNGLFAPDAQANGSGEGALFSNNDGGFGNIAAGSTDLGPCFSQDGAKQFYSTAGPGYTNACTGGETVGIGPFDATQSCTDPFPLTYSPSGSTSITSSTTCPAGVTAPCLTLGPLGLNSTYLPNGTLNQWDAPMPPAQISFGVTGGPGFLDEVNKTGLYSLIFDAGAPSSTGTCPTGYAVSPVTGTCHLDIDPNPFYAEAIPASPFIPNITNNGGYLWNSWNFSAGTVTTVSSTGAFGAAAGGFVPGQSTTATVPVASLPGAACPTTIFTTLSGTTCTVPGGINVTACTRTTTSDSIIVANGAGFLPGMSVEVYNSTTGATTAGGTSLVTGPVIQSVMPAPQAGYPGAVELVFNAGALTTAGVCTATPYSEVFIAEQFGLPVPSVVPFTSQAPASGATNCGGNITLGGGTGTDLTLTSGGNSFPVVLCDTTNNIVYVSSAESVAATFGPCTGGISRTGGPAANPYCEPSSLVAAGTIIETGPKAAGGMATGPVPNPYPFWQWVPSSPGKGAAPTSATVYSDNHGEAVVSLDTAVATQVPPVAGACPKGYTAQSINGTIVTCQLPFSALGSMGYASVAAALSNFSATKPGCIQTYPSGTFAVLANATIGATGPAAGQICINALGGIEFGASASLGTTTVSAIADYPYTRGEHPPIASANLTKVWTSLFNKSLTVSAGTPGPANTTSYTVTVTAKDICGNPLFGEPIEVFALGNAGATVLASVATTGGGVLLTQGSNNAVVTVDPVTGQATLSLEVLNTAIGTSGLVIKAVFRSEAIERFVTVIPGTTPGAVVNVPYGPGWQMVGGPAGSNFSTSEALFAWDPVAGQYTNATASAANLSSAAPACTGYWSYFAAAMVVSLPATSTSGQTAACTLKAGWNLVGNPFATPATLPSGTTAYYWNGTSYTTVGTIPVGGSVWVFNDGTLNSLTLTAT